VCILLRASPCVVEHAMLMHSIPFLLNNSSAKTQRRGHQQQLLV
jgi:hypothetical protein